MEFTFNSLTFENQMQICSYLSVNDLRHLFAPVCKKWKWLASQPVLRREITLDREVQSVKRMDKTVRNSFKIRKISFIHISKWYVLSRSLPTLNYLRRFEFTNCNINATCIKRLVVRFPAIEGVKLDFVSGQYNLLVVQLIAEWRFLKDISINAKSLWPTDDGTKIVELYATKCEYLRELELFNFTIWGRAIKKLTKLRGSTLEKLYLGDDVKDIWVKNDMSRCLARCPNLKSVYLTPEFSAVSLQNNGLLQELLASRYSSYLCRLLRERTYNNLSVLKVFFSVFNAELLHKQCPVLKILNINWNNIDDDEAAFIALHCKKLERFSITSNYIITPASISSIIRNPTNLSYLKFSQCEHVKKTSENLATLAEARILKPNLEIVIN